MLKDKIKLTRASMRPAILIGVCCLLLFSAPVNAASTVGPKAEIVWSEVIDGNNQIFYSALTEDNRWRPKIQLSQSDDINAAPAISAGNDGRTWVVWAAVDGMTSRLFYTCFDGTQWSDPEEMPSPLASNAGPSIAFDQDNTLWVVWVGFDGVDDDIFCARYKNNTWDTPVRINSDNDVPDVSPQIMITADNVPSVYWLGFEGDTYRQFVSTLGPEGWSEKELVDREAFKASLRKEMMSLPALPEGLQAAQQASIHIRSKTGLQSIPLKTH